MDRQAMQEDLSKVFEAHGLNMQSLKIDMGWEEQGQSCGWISAWVKVKG